LRLLQTSRLQEFLHTQNRYDFPRRAALDSVGPEADLNIREDDVIETAPLAPPSTNLNDPHPTSRFQTRATVDYSSFPTRSQCDFLLEIFLKNFQSVMPLIHVPTFLERYQIFWSHAQGNQGQVQSTPAFLSLLYAILYAGSAVGSSSTLDVVFSYTSRAELSKDLYAKTTAALKRASFARTPAIDSFTAYMIAQSIWSREEEPLRSWWVANCAVF
jgi:hypothetical protein